MRFILFKGTPLLLSLKILMANNSSFSSNIYYNNNFKLYMFLY